MGNPKSVTDPTDVDLGSDGDESDENVVPVDESESSDISLINDLRATVQAGSPTWVRRVVQASPDRTR